MDQSKGKSSEGMPKGGRLNDRKAESEQFEILEVDSGVCNCTSGLTVPAGFLYTYFYLFVFCVESFIFCIEGCFLVRFIFIHYEDEAAQL